jgi:hypothetical protein
LYSSWEKIIVGESKIITIERNVIIVEKKVTIIERMVVIKQHLIERQHSSNNQEKCNNWTIDERKG